MLSVFVAISETSQFTANAVLTIQQQKSKISELSSQRAKLMAELEQSTSQNSELQQKLQELKENDKKVSEAFLDVIEGLSEQIDTLRARIAELESSRHYTGGGGSSGSSSSSSPPIGIWPPIPKNEIAPPRIE